MESTTNWEYNTLINELTHGREQAMQLRLHLNSTPFPQPQDLLQKILASYERSLLILNWNGPLVQPQPPILPITALESSLSVDGSPCSDEMSKNVPTNECHSSISRKRKAMPTWTKLVRINPQTGLEGPGDDGYSWRKYGQKDILGTNYPRSYYRCTYRHTHDCWATKQVQRSDEDPSVFELTYKGNHTCIPASGSSPPPPTSPKKQEPKHNYHYHNNNEMLMHLKANLRVKTDDSETIKHEKSPVSALPTAGKNHECSLPVFVPNDHHFPRTYTPPFISPTTSESNYYSASSSQMNEFGHFQDLRHSESEQNGMFSGNASSTNSPIAGLEFLMDPVASDSKYPFDTTGFFS